jgi:hypothetical protein
VVLLVNEGAKYLFNCAACTFGYSINSRVVRALEKLVCMGFKRVCQKEEINLQSRLEKMARHRILIEMAYEGTKSRKNMSDGPSERS